MKRLIAAIASAIRSADISEKDVIGFYAAQKAASKSLYC